MKVFYLTKQECEDMTQVLSSLVPVVADKLTLQKLIGHFENAACVNGTVAFDDALLTALKNMYNKIKSQTANSLYPVFFNK